MNTQSQGATLVVRLKRALYFIGGAGVVLALLSFASQYLRLFPDLINIRFPYQADLLGDFKLEFDFNGRSSIVIFFNMLFFNMAACLLFVIAFLKNINKEKYRFSWTAMAWTVLLFAVDSFADLSKKLEIIVKDKKAGSVGVDVPWLLIGTAILFVLFLFFWLQLDRKFKPLFSASLIMCLAGVLVKGLAGLQDVNLLNYVMYLTLAQILEYGAGITLVYSLLIYLTSNYPVFFVSTE